MSVLTQKGKIALVYMLLASLLVWIHLVFYGIIPVETPKAQWNDKQLELEVHCLNNNTPVTGSPSGDPNASLFSMSDGEVVNGIDERFDNEGNPRLTTAQRMTIANHAETLSPWISKEKVTTVKAVNHFSIVSQVSFFLSVIFTLLAGVLSPVMFREEKTKKQAQLGGILGVPQLMGLIIIILYFTGIIAFLSYLGAMFYMIAGVTIAGIAVYRGDLSVEPDV